MAAEFAVLVPAVVLLLALCLSAVQVSTRQLRLHDAAAVAARMLARGEAERSVAGQAAALLAGSSFEAHRRGELLCVRLSAPGLPGGGVFSRVALSATSCALDDGW